MLKKVLDTLSQAHSVAASDSYQSKIYVLRMNLLMDEVPDVQKRAFAQMGVNFSFW